jgi:hypothetical protein
MRSANIQSVSGEKDSREQDQDERTKRHREEKKTQRDYTGYPSESNRKKNRQKQDREQTWVPQEFSTTKIVQNWFVQQVPQMAKLNGEKRVNLKGQN